MFKKIKNLINHQSNRDEFDDSKLSQLKIWNTSLMFSIISSLSFALIFAFMAKIDEVVVARGEIQALGAERPIKSKISGIIDKVLINEGDQVNKGQLLISINKESLEANLVALIKEKTNLEKALDLQREIINRARDVYDSGAISLLEIMRLEKIFLEINSNLERKKSEIKLANIGINDSNNVFSFLEKPQGDGGWINGGFFVFNREILNRISNDNTLLEQEPLKSLADDKQLNAYKHYDFWKPMDTLRDKNHLEIMWEKQKAPWKVW